MVETVSVLILRLQKIWLAHGDIPVLRVNEDYLVENPAHPVGLFVHKIGEDVIKKHSRELPENATEALYVSI